MKWTMITALAIVMCTTIACEKGAIENEMETQVAGITAETGSIVGTWSMVEYYEDRGDGTGEWKPATHTETLTFGSNASFSYSPTFPNASLGFDHYKVNNNTMVTLVNSSSGWSDVYEYRMENATTLVFFPKCRETCARRYTLIASGK